MKCGKTRRLLALLAGGDLDLKTGRKAARHAAGCASCGALAQELALDHEWLGSAPLSFDEDELFDLRRRVWRAIAREERSRARVRSVQWALAGGGVLAAVLTALLLLRQPRAAAAPAGSAARALPATPAAARAALAPSSEPSRASVERPRHPLGASRLARRADPSPMKIEFQTANPDVRIIWLVGQGGATPRILPGGRNQEVS